MRIDLQLLAGFALVTGLGAAPAARQGELEAGAARIEITPGKGDALPMSGYAARKEGHKGIHDALYVRAIVFSGETARAAIVTADLIGFSHAFWNTVSERIASEAKIPRENILIAGTHTHSAPSPGTYDPAIDPESPQGRYIRRVQDAMVEAVGQAQRQMQPARIGAASGRANVNVNRRAIAGDGSLWLGIDPDGPADKTLAVVKIETSAGEPLAIFANYAVHGTGMGQDNYLISADVPGASSRYVEKRFKDKVVAVWTSGAAGDLCPIYDRNPSRFNGIDAIGRILGEEILRTADKIKTSPRASIRGVQKVVTCPGQKLIPGPHGRADGRFEDADPVPIRLSLLRVNDIAITGVSGEVLTMVGQRLKRESKLPNTVMVTHCNGSSGYLPDDAAYKQLSYEIYTTRVKAGCAESAIVNGLLEMMRAK